MRTPSAEHRNGSLRMGMGGGDKTGDSPYGCPEAPENPRHGLAGAHVHPENLHQDPSGIDASQPPMCYWRARGSPRLTGMSPFHNASFRLGLVHRNLQVGRVRIGFATAFDITLGFYTNEVDDHRVMLICGSVCHGCCNGDGSTKEER